MQRELSKFLRISEKIKLFCTKNKKFDLWKSKLLSSPYRLQSLHLCSRYC